MPSYTSEELRKMRAKGENRTDWDKVDTISNEEIDDSDIPAGFWENATVVYPQKNVQKHKE
jgi:hypothetical protein